MTILCNKEKSDILKYNLVQLVQLNAYLNKELDLKDNKDVINAS